MNMVNSSITNIVGIGDVCIQTNNGGTLRLKGMQHVPDLRLNMIFVHALDLDGYPNSFGDGKWKLTKGSLMVAKGIVYSTLYKTQVKLIRDGLNAVEDHALPDLYHRNWLT